MTEICASHLPYDVLNARIRAAGPELSVDGCLGQRYIGSGSSGQSILLYGTPGNALGAYLDGSSIEVFGNVQDAVGDTMNGGRICVHGCAGDALGYAMRGGTILVHGDAGYRAGIHMKEYRDKRPALVIGGRAGSFLGEYQAGGIIAVLGLNGDGPAPVGNFCGTGMHGGKIYLRCETLPPDLPEQVLAAPAEEADLGELRPLLEEFCAAFGEDPDGLLQSRFYVLRPNARNPYHRLYTPD